MRAVRVNGRRRTGSQSESERACCALELLETRALFSIAVPDLGFGDAGLTRFDALGAYDTVAAVVVQDDGKVVVAGYSYEQNEFSATYTTMRGVVARLNPDGTPDATFGGGDGVVTLDRISRVAAVALAADGMIVLGGITAVNSRATLVRLTSDGSPDASFGAGGVAIVDDLYFGSGSGFTSIAVHPTTGKIVGIARIHFNVWGTGEVPTDVDMGDFAVARFNHDGTADTTFGGDGLVTTDFGHSAGGGSDEARTIGFLPGDRILVGGTTGDSGPASAGARDGGFAFACYNDDGSLDAAFGAGGLVVTRFAGPPDIDQKGYGSVDDLVVLPDGSFAAAGVSSEANLTIARYLPGGALDPSFGADGLARVDGGTAGSSHLVALPEGRLAAASGSQERLYAAVLDAAGGVMQSLHFAHPDARYESYAAVAFAPDGKLVAAGSAAPRTTTADDDISAWLQTLDVLVGRFAFDFDTAPLPNPAMTRPLPPAPVPTGPAVSGGTGSTREEALRARREARQAARAAKRAAREARRLALRLEREQRRQLRLQERLRRLELLQSVRESAGRAATV